jgi:hypothetical protein
METISSHHRERPMSEINPPTDADRERASTDWVKEAQELWVAGYRCRQSEEPPEREQPGTKRKVRNWNESLAHLAKARVPADLPAHKRERWTAGFLHADGIAVLKGHRHKARHKIGLAKFNALHNTDLLAAAARNWRESPHGETEHGKRDARD